jgi:hypothetical protein
MKKASTCSGKGQADWNRPLRGAIAETTAIWLAARKYRNHPKPTTLKTRTASDCNLSEFSDSEKYLVNAATNCVGQELHRLQPREIVENHHAGKRSEGRARLAKTR